MVGMKLAGQMSHSTLLVLYFTLSGLELCYVGDVRVTVLFMPDDFNSFYSDDQTVYICKCCSVELLLYCDNTWQVNVEKIKGFR